MRLILASEAPNKACYFVERFSLSPFWQTLLQLK